MSLSTGLQCHARVRSGGVVMQHGVPRKLDGHLDHSWLLYRALLAIVAGLAALVACYVVYLALVTAYILWG